MNDWFSIEKIDDTTFSISEWRHWEETHSYLLIGDREALLIDTGMGISDISKVVSSLTDKPIVAVATHVHYDHVGGHRYYSDNFYVHADEYDWISGNFPLTPEQIKGFIIERPCDFPPEFDLSGYEMFKGIPRRILYGGEILNPGGRKVCVIHTPGHAPGHMCFYEPERQYLYTGDLIYIGELFMYYPSTDPLAYRNSVNGLLDLKVDKILPAHHSLNVPTAILLEISNAFDKLADNNLLKHGTGIFDYGQFQLHL